MGRIMILRPEAMTKTERSCLLYLESCAVDGGGLVEAVRMNDEDWVAVARFEKLQMLRVHRIPSELLGVGARQDWTHWAFLLPEGWKVAHACREVRAEQLGPYARSVRNHLRAVCKHEFVQDPRAPTAEICVNCGEERA